MRFFIAFVVVAVAVCQAVELTPEQKTKLLDYHKECDAQSGISDAIIAEALSGKLAEDPKIKVYLFCMGKKLGLQNDAGEIQKEVVEKKMTDVLKDKQVVDGIMEKCAIKKDTPEETAFASFKCFWENTKDHLSLLA